jgi:hypothetical protein
VTNTVSTPSWFTLRKSVKPSNFDCPSKLQNPIKLDVDKYVTSRLLLCKCLPRLLSYSNIYSSLSSSIFLSSSTHDSLTLYPMTIPSYYPTDLSFHPFTGCFWPFSFRTLYFDILRNKFAHTLNKIVSTGYRLPCERLITFATLKFESFQCCVHLTRSITQIQILHIFQSPYVCLGSLLYTMELRQFSKTLHYYTHSQLMEHWPTLASFRSTAWFYNPYKIPSLCFPTSSWFYNSIPLCY